MGEAAEADGGGPAVSGLNAFFRPSGCAVLGASRDEQKAGHQILKNMIRASRCGGDAVYPVNPAGDEVLGRKSYRTISEIPGQVELVIWAVPGNYTESVLADMRARQDERGDLQAVVVVAAGFSEAGSREGVRREEMLVSCCREMGVRVLGPNCVGVIDTSSGLDTTFILGTELLDGGVSFVSQSGAMGAWLVESWSSEIPPVGFNKFISVGNMSDVSIIEMLDYLRDDPETSTVGIYLEGYEQGRRLAECLRSLSAEKPVVALKVGKTEQGARAARSHTGSLAGRDRVYDGIFKQVGVCRAHSVSELSASVQAFDRLPAPAGRRVFILTQAGGPGIYTADLLMSGGGVERARISDSTRRQLRDILPPFASICEPEGHADITAAATARQHAEAAEAILRDDGVDSLILVTVPVTFVPAEDIASELLDVVHALRKDGIDKPLLPVLLAGRPVAGGVRMLDEGGVMTFETPDDAAGALLKITDYYARGRG